MNKLKTNDTTEQLTRVYENNNKNLYMGKLTTIKTKWVVSANSIESKTQLSNSTGILPHSKQEIDIASRVSELELKDSR